MNNKLLKLKAAVQDDPKCLGSKSLEEKLILKKIELDKVALREPQTLQQYKIRKNWDRVHNILVKRYGRHD